MNRIFLFAVAAALAIGSVYAEDEVKTITLNPPVGNPRFFNNAPTGAYGASRVETKLNVSIKDDTKKVHFIRDNSDPYVVTKAYLVKNADAFVLRGVLKTVTSGSIADNPVTIDSVKYVDGSSVILISAEEYRFKNAVNGMTMDQLVEALDKKGLPNSSGTVDMAYFPKYIPASILLPMMQESGIGFTGYAQAKVIAANSEYTNATSYMHNGAHVAPFAYAAVDNKMNAIVMTAPGHDLAESMNFLKEVDKPLKEIKLNYKVIEVYAENDQKLGLDFQAWKNNDGIDLFSAGGKYGTNWSNGLVPNNGYTYTEFYNFNPKWNTKYLDFLTVCGKAKIVSTGSLTIADGGIANLTMADGLFSIVGKEIKNESTTPKTSDVTTVTTTETDEETGTQTTTVHTTTEETGPKTGLISWVLGDILPSGEAGKYYKRRSEEIPKTALDQEIRQGRTQDIEAQDGTLFQFSVAGDVHCDAANLNVALASTSIIGWDGQGKARLTKSFYNTEIQIGNKKNDFVIGGLNKSSIVRSVSGVPLLKDLPGIGWIFSTETDTVKKSQYVVVCSAEILWPSTQISKEVKSDIKSVTTKVEKAVKSPMSTLGFQQLLIDQYK